MKKFSLLSLAAGLALIFVGFGTSPEIQDAQAWAKDCKRTEFKTKTVEEACKKGGQKEAKKAMKKFLKVAKKQNSDLNCKSCHTSLSSAKGYPLKPDGLEMYKKLGGK